jgi:hypothetical protein
MGVAPAGVDKPNTGHHHLLVDTTLSPDELKRPIAMDAKHLHFGGGQTENHADPSARLTHASARARRLVAYSIQSADHVTDYHHYGEVTAVSG